MSEFYTLGLHSYLLNNWIKLLFSKPKHYITQQFHFSVSIPGDM